METKELTDKLEHILECLIGSCVTNITGEDQLDNLITELKAKNNEVLDIVSKCFVVTECNTFRSIFISKVNAEKMNDMYKRNRIGGNWKVEEMPLLP